jgi:hypothetical protein
VAPPRKPLATETTRFTLYGWPRGHHHPAGYRGIPLGHRPTLEEATAVIPTLQAEGYTIARIVERMRDYPFTHLREFAADGTKKGG